MLPIVDSNWSPASQDAAINCHILRAIAVQYAMPDKEIDSNLVALKQHAKTPGLGGLPNGIAAYLDIAAPDAAARIETLLLSDRVLGVNVVLNSESNSNADLQKLCIDVLDSNQLSIDISGDVDSIRHFLQMAEHVPKLNMICNISQCSRAGKLLAIGEWPSFVGVLTAYDNVTVKITDPPAGEFIKAADQLRQAIQQLARSVGIARVLFGSGVTRAKLPDDRNVWQYFDASTRWASALERDQFFRGNAVHIYRL